jgi:hypothetical protein
LTQGLELERQRIDLLQKRGMDKARHSLEPNDQLLIAF